MSCWSFCSAFCATANPWRVLDRERAVPAGPAVLLGDTGFEPVTSPVSAKWTCLVSSN